MEEVTITSKIFYAAMLMLLIVLAFFFLKSKHKDKATPTLSFPEEQRLKALFQTKRSAFEHIRRMSLEDGENPFLISDTDSQSSGLPVDRIHTYRSALNLIDSELTLIRDADHILKFETDGVWPALGTGSGWDRGVAYVPASAEGKCHFIVNPSQIVPRVEDIYFIRIDHQWCVFQGQYD